MTKIRIFVAAHCEPCNPLKEMLSKGNLSEDIEVVDVESPEGFALVDEVGVEGVPSAYRGRQRCEIEVDEEHDIVNIICPGDTPYPGDTPDSPESSSEPVPE